MVSMIWWSAARGGKEESGAIVVLPGSDTGIRPGRAADQSQHPRRAGKEVPQDNFGAAIAVGDVTGDGYDDLSVISEENEAPATIHLFPGSPDGVNSTNEIGPTDWPRAESA